LQSGRRSRKRPPAQRFPSWIILIQNDFQSVFKLMKACTARSTASHGCATQIASNLGHPKKIEAIRKIFRQPQKKTFSGNPGSL